MSDNPGAADAGPPSAAAAARRPIRPKDAASLILWRDGPAGAEVLMGLRHAGHRFMPNRLVFPGGRVDRGDYGAAAASELRAETAAMLMRRADARLARALAVAAVRELHEETGLLLGRPAKASVAPALGRLDYLCRAVTPPSMPVRFNARFLIAPAEAVNGEIAGSGELEGLRWFGVEEALSLPLAFITAKVLGEFKDWLAMPARGRASRELIWFQGQERRRVER